MSDFFEKLKEIYDSADDIIKGISAINDAITIENQFRQDDEKLSLKEITEKLDLIEEYNLYEFHLQVNNL